MVSKNLMVMVVINGCVSSTPCSDKEGPAVFRE